MCYNILIIVKKVSNGGVYMTENLDYGLIDTIIASYEAKPCNIIAILQEIQAQYRYLPRDVFAYLAKNLKMSAAKIYSVATFYENFSLEPKGKFVIKICDGTACHVRKSVPILEKMREVLQLSAEKQTTDDMLFTVETVSCLGACGLAPAITVNDKVYPSMSPESATALISELKEEA